jgi:hypothetical protein
VTQYTATVTALTAEVRVLMVGSRQVTLSVYRQLDTVPYELIEPLGRVRDSRDGIGINVVGRRVDSGDLVRSALYVLETEYRESRNAKRSEAFDREVAELQLQIDDGLKWIEDRRKKIETVDAGGTIVDAGYWDTRPDYVHGIVRRENEIDGLRAELLEKHAAEGAEIESIRQDEKRAEAWEALPLIVLAGLT